MAMMDATFDFLLRSFRVRSRELPAEEALKHAGALKRFFAVELNYKNTPIRLIVAASEVPREFQTPMGSRGILNLKAVEGSRGILTTAESNGKSQLPGNSEHGDGGDGGAAA